MASSLFRIQRRRRSVLAIGGLLPLVATIPVSLLAPAASAASHRAPAVSAKPEVKAMGDSVSGAPSVVRLPTGVVGAPYYASIPQGTKGATWRWEGGVLPPGLRFGNGMQLVSGLPRAAGVWTIRLSRVVTGARLPETRLVRISISGVPAERATAPRTTPTTGAMSGTVKSSSRPISGACVEAESPGGSIHRAMTSSSGAYAISGLQPGIWEVLFSGCGTKNFVAQWSNGQASQTTAKAIAITAGKTAANVSATLASGGEVTGTVLAQGTTTGLASICVFAFNAVPINSPTDGASGSAVTNASGDYTIVGLAAGSYQVEYFPCSNSVNRLPTAYGTADDAVSPPVTVVAGQTTANISTVMIAGGEVSGRVTSAATHKGVGGICATVEQPEVSFVSVEGASPASTSAAVPPATEAGGNASEYGVAVTSGNGTYTIAGLASGDYEVIFFSCGEFSTVPYVLPLVWGATKDPTVMPPVVVTEGSNTSAINASLTIGGRVSGTIKSATTGKPLAGACALIGGANTANGYFAETNAEGNYMAEGIAPGAYIAEFGPCGNQNYVASFWHNGAAFAVRTGKTTGAISGNLSPGGVVAGSVTSATGTPLTGLCLVLDETTGSGSFGEEIAPEGFGGTFNLAGLPTGNYSIGFTGSCGIGGANYLQAFWDGGIPVTVKAGGPVVNGLAIKLPVGGSISGKVSDSLADPLSYVCVEAEPVGESGFALPSEAISFGGTYHIVGLASGEYQVFFADCSGENLLGAEYENGLEVKVTAGKATSGISEVLQPGGEISGTVTSASHVGLSDICVTILGEFQPQPIELFTTFGSYDVVGLPPNTEYEIEFAACGVGNFATQWWQDAATQSAATPVTVTTQSPATNIDATMVS